MSNWVTPRAIAEIVDDIAALKEGTGLEIHQDNAGGRMRFMLEDTDENRERARELARELHVRQAEDFRFILTTKVIARGEIIWSAEIRE